MRIPLEPQGCQFVSQIGTLVFAKNAQGEANQRPKMDSMPFFPVVFGKVVDLGVAIVAGGDAVMGAGSQNLIALPQTIGPTLLGESCLEGSSAATAAIIVGFVGVHIHEVFFSNEFFDHEAEVVGNGVPQGFAHQLARVLDGELQSQLCIPIAGHR